MAAKLALGTAQFGMPYGVTNRVGVPSDEQLHLLLGEAKAAAIDCLDTASAYGNAQSRLGGCDLTAFKVITKIPQGTETRDLEPWLMGVLSELHVSSVHGVLFHGQEDALLCDFPEKLQQLITLKNQGLIEKIGISGYELNLLMPILTDPEIGLVQIPLNVLNGENGKLLARLKVVNPAIEIHARSVFLQGALLANPTALPYHLRNLQSGVEWFLDYCDQAKVNPGVAAMAYALQFPVDALIMGVTSVAELKQLVQWFQEAQETTVVIPDRVFHDEYDPRNW